MKSVSNRIKEIEGRILLMPIWDKEWLIAKVKELEETKDASRSVRASLVCEVDKLQAKVKELENGLKVSADSLYTVCNGVTQLKEENAKLKVSVEAREVEKVYFEKENAKLKQQLTEARERVTYEQKRASDLEKENERLKKDLKWSGAEIGSWVVKNAELKKEIEGWIVKEACGLIPPDDWKEQNAKLKKELEDLYRINYKLSHIKKLTALLEKCREGLEFYGDDETWRTRGVQLRPIIWDDNGSRATALVKEIDEAVK